MATNQLPHVGHCECLACQIARDAAPPLKYNHYQPKDSPTAYHATGMEKHGSTWTVHFKAVWYDERAGEWRSQSRSFPYEMWEKYSRQARDDNRGMNP